MKFFSWTQLCVTLFTFQLILSGSAAAFCGLQSCPRIGPHAGSAPFEAGFRTRFVNFDIAGEHGFYGVYSPRFFAKAMGLSLGVEAPWVNLHTAEGTTSGLGNPLVIAQYARQLGPAWSAQAGVQLELPLGNADHGLADDHMMVLPWVGGRKEWGPWLYTSGMLGFSETLDGGGEVGMAGSAQIAPLAKSAHDGIDHGAGATPVYVNPHGDTEVHWRAALGRRIGTAWSVECFGLGQSDLSNSKVGFYSRGGVAVDWTLPSSVGLHFIADVPVSPDRRSDGSLSLDVKVGW